ncbi:glycine zipper 2TM domain-containing protein [Aquitalea sp. S1-19]|nr:glycine zipper 2TM domain-containing protein [Aquitalea sp. S1-19]
MKTTLTRSLLILTLAASMAGCAGMSQQQKNTAVGAAIGGVAGSVLTNGGTLGTVGGAAIGGAIGHGVK